MPPFDIIKGTKLNGLMKELIADQTLIKLSVAGSAYERLTVITQLRPEKAPLYFRIDPPQGVKTAIKRRRAKSLDFEFTGHDQVIHRFDANLHQDLTDDIWLEYPEQIQRVQQRQNVRIDPGRNSLLLLDLKGRHLDLHIENLSAGGVLCTCPNKFKPLIEIGQQWEDVSLKLASGMDAYHITVGRLQVLRITAGSRPKHFKIAIAFLQINKQTHQKLLHFINSCQREMLKNRKK